MKEVLIKYIEKDRTENILTDLEKTCFPKHPMRVIKLMLHIQILM